MQNALSDYPGSMTPDNAVEALTRAAGMGFLPAPYWCGWLYQYHPYIFLRTWYYGSPSCALMHYRKAESFYQKAIRAGDMNAHYDRERDKELRQSDNEFRWKRQMDEEMQQRLKELPPRFHASIYDEYAEKRKRFLERKGKK